MSDATAWEVALRVVELLRIPGALRWFLDRIKACRAMEIRYMAAKETRERRVSWQKYRSDIERIKSDPDNYINPLLTPVDPRWVWMSFTAPDGQPEEKVGGWVELRDEEEMEPGIPIDTLPPSPFPDPLNDDDNRRPQQGQYDAGNAWLLAVIHDRMQPKRPAIIDPGFEAPGRMSLHLKHSKQIAWSFPEFSSEHIGFALQDVEGELKDLAAPQALPSANVVAEAGRTGGGAGAGGVAGEGADHACRQAGAGTSPGGAGAADGAGARRRSGPANLVAAAVPSDRDQVQQGKHRIVFEPEAVVLDGVRYTMTEEGAKIVQRLWEARGGRVLGENLKVSRSSSERPDKIIKGFPKPVHQLIDSKPGRSGGFRLKVEMLAMDNLNGE